MATAKELPFLRRKLLKWFKEFGRKFAWRERTTPYEVLIAEIMLQRTQARQVEPVYINFLNKYPDVESLANARLEDVAVLVRSLGLPTRHKDLIKVACEIIELFNGEIPDNREKLKLLTGVGDYIAGQILAQSFKQRGWIVDTNVVRVFCRFFGLKITGEARRAKPMIALAQRWSLTRSPDKANLALLDFAALICKPKTPLCMECPVRQKCSYFAENKSSILLKTTSGSVPQNQKGT